MRLSALFMCAALAASLGFASPDHAIRVSPYFKSVEHQTLGNSVTLEFSGGEKINAALRKLTLPNTNRLNYGDIVAIGGDFYGIPDQPISDGKTLANRVQRFLNAFAELGNEEPTLRCNYDFCANKVLEVIAGEAQSLIGHDMDQPIERRGLKAALQLEFFTQNNVLSLALRNWDHFLPTSMLAYEAGHTAAMQMALKARDLPTANEKNAQLELAYAMNAFSDHFLTDMFSSGHLRVPRRELYEQSTTASIAGLLANLMHDEDGRVGLSVRNKRGDRWKMFGDGMLYIPLARDNARIVAMAVGTSAAEVAKAFTTGELTAVENMGIKDLVAQLEDNLMHPRDAGENSAPLYSLDNEGKVLARDPQNSRCSYNWTDDWTGMSQWLGYRTGGDGSDCRFNPGNETNF